MKRSIFNFKRKLFCFPLNCLLKNSSFVEKLTYFSFCFIDVVECLSPYGEEDQAHVDRKREIGSNSMTSRIKIKIKSERTSSRILRSSHMSSSGIKSESNCSQLKDIKPEVSKIINSPIKKNGKFFCPNCNKSYKHEFSAKTHLRFVCGQKPRFKCPHCNALGSYYHNIITHAKKQHPNFESYAIDVTTNKIMGLRKELGNSSLDSSLDNNLNLDEKVTRKKSSIKNSHQLDMKDKNIICQTPNLTIKIKQQKSNKKGSNKSTDNNDFFRRLTPNTCLDCGKTFKMEYGLSRHILAGCHKFRYKCPYCEFREGKLFVTLCHVSKEHAGSQIYAIDNVTGKNVGLKNTTSMETFSTDQADFNNPSINVNLRTRSLTSRNNSSIKKENNHEVKNPLNKLANQSKGDSKSSKNHKQYECPNKCGQFLVNPRGIAIHLKKTCNQVNRFKCPYCNDRATSFRLIAAHIIVNHPKKNVYAIDLVRKRPMYENPHAARFFCPKGCGVSFSRKHHMKSHTENVCGVPKRYKCPYCYCVCKQIRSITKHVQNRHPNMKNYYIDILKKDGAKSEQEEENLNIGEEKPKFQCSHCKKNFKNVRNMWTHIKNCHFINNDMKVESESIHLNDQKYESIKNELIDNESNEDLETMKNEYQSAAAGDNANEISNKVEEIDVSDDEVSKNELSDNEINEEISKFVQMEADKENVEKVIENSETKEIAKPFSKKKFACPNNCGCVYYREAALKSHIRYQCGQLARFKCPYCDYYSKQTSNGYSHVRRLHAGHELYLIDVIKKDRIYQTKKRVVKEDKESGVQDLSNESIEELEEIDEPDDPIIELENDIDPSVYMCPYCTFHTEIPEEGYAHMKRKHPGKNIFMNTLKMK